MALDLSALDGLGGAVSEPALRLAPTAPPSHFIEDPDQPRVEFEEDEDFLALVEDVRRRGILQPIVVRRQSLDKLLLRFGARRLRAAIAAGLSRVPYIETDDERQLDDYAQVSENHFRRPLQALELARFIERKIAAGEKKKQVAVRLQLDPSAVTHLLALAYEPPTLLLELYHSRRCRAPHLLYALRRLIDQHGPALEDALADGQVVDRHRVDALTAQLNGDAKAALPAAQIAAENGSVRATGSETNTASPAPVPSKRGTNERRGDSSATLPGEGSVDATDDRHAAPLQSTHRARLFGRHDDVAVEILLDRTPTTQGMAWTRQVDEGRVAELALEQIVMCCLQVEYLPVAVPAAAPSAERSSG
jgi:ParB family chromosome partitioning protein